MQVTGLYIYPIKSCRAIMLKQSEVTPLGLKYDRQWMLINDDNKMITQRTHAALCRIQPSIEDELLHVNDLEGNRSIDISINYQGDEVQVQIWEDEVPAIVAAEGVNEWFSAYLGESVRLVRLSHKANRQVDVGYASKGQLTTFTDGFPLLMISEASLADLNSRLDAPVDMLRFRPNIVVNGLLAYQEDELTDFKLQGLSFKGVKPSSRCVVITIDHSTSNKGKEPLKTLAKYRLKDSKVYFGMNVLPMDIGKLRIV